MCRVLAWHWTGAPDESVPLRISSPGDSFRCFSPSVIPRECRTGVLCRSLHFFCHPRDGIPCQNITLRIMSGWHRGSSGATLADPHRSSGVGPWNRVPVALPRHIRIARDLPQFFIDVWIWRAAIDRLQPLLLFSPPLIDLFVCRAMDPPIGHFPGPLPQLAVEVRQVTRFATDSSSLATP